MHMAYMRAHRVEGFKGAHGRYHLEERVEDVCRREEPPRVAPRRRLRESSEQPHCHRTGICTNALLRLTLASTGRPLQPVTRERADGHGTFGSAQGGSNGRACHVRQGRARQVPKHFYRQFMAPRQRRCLHGDPNRLEAHIGKAAAIHGEGTVGCDELRGELDSRFTLRDGDEHSERLLDQFNGIRARIQTVPEGLEHNCNALSDEDLVGEAATHESGECSQSDFS